MYLPESTPPLSGDHGVTPRPSSCAIGMSSPSTVRSRSEYSIWSATSGVQPRKRAIVCACGHLPRRRVGEADVADLAGAHEVVERAHRLLDRRVLVPGVHPVEVDVVGLQPAQRLLAAGRERLAAGAAAVRIAREEVARELGGDDDAVAPARVAADVVADDLLGVAVGVDVGGVDEVAAALEEAVEDGLGVLDAGAPAPVLAEGHRAEAERADAQAGAAEGDVVVERRPSYPLLVAPFRHTLCDTGRPMRVPYLTSRLRGFGTSVFAEYTALATQHGAVNLGQGFPDFDGPDFVKEAAIAAIREGRNQYSPMIGLPELRRAVAEHQQRFYGLDYDPDREVTVYAGATEAIFSTLAGAARARRRGRALRALLRLLPRRASPWPGPRPAW